MLRIRYILFISACLFFTTIAQAASFDCKKATTQLEKTICSDEVLSAFDDKLANAYSDALASLSPEGQKETKEYQLQWLKNLSSYCEARMKFAWHEDAAKCLKDAYRKRIEELQKSLIKYPARTFRTVYVSHSQTSKTCFHGFIKRELTYPQIENPNESDKFWNNVIYKIASGELDNPFCQVDDPTKCENACVNIDANITISFSNKHVISFQKNQWTYADGAAHGYGNGASYNWLLDAKRELKASDLFDNKTKWQSKLKELVTQKLEKQEAVNKEGYDEFLRANVLKEVGSPENWQLSKDGLGFPFYKRWWGGPDILTIDWKTLEPYLSKNGRSLIQVQVWPVRGGK